MDNDVKYVQLQIKAFNKALSRADKANILGGDTYATINDLIDYERMTRSGYAKAGAKYLEKMDPDELAAYSSDIKQAKDLIELEKTISLIDIESTTDSKALLWKMYQKLEDSGLAFDSDQVQAVLEKDSGITIREMALHMNRYLTDMDYGLSDFDEWFNSKISLE